MGRCPPPPPVKQDTIIPITYINIVNIMWEWGLVLRGNDVAEAKTENVDI